MKHVGTVFQSVRIFSSLLIFHRLLFLFIVPLITFEATVARLESFQATPGACSPALWNATLFYIRENSRIGTAVSIEIEMAAETNKCTRARVDSFLEHVLINFLNRSQTCSSVSAIKGRWTIHFNNIDNLIKSEYMCQQQKRSRYTSVAVTLIHVRDI